MYAAARGAGGERPGRAGAATCSPARRGEITVGDILRALEGGLTLLDCLDEEDACGKSCDCPSRKIWQRLRDGINEIVDGITLDDMLRRDDK